MLTLLPREQTFMKTLFTIAGDHISARFDMTREVLIAVWDETGLLEEPKTILLDKTSAEDLCNFIIMENIDSVVCGGIEEKHFKYLRWKKAAIFDSVIGPHEEAFERLLTNNLKACTILPGARD